MSVLEELYYGNISDDSQDYKAEGEEEQYDECTKIQCDIEEIFKNRLEDKNKYLFERYIEAKDEILSIENKRHFINGWKLCARFIFDTFSA